MEAEAGQERVRSILESITDSFFSVDRSWRITAVNQRAATNFRRSREELLGRSMWDLSLEGATPDVDAPYRKVMTERVTVHFDAPSGADPRRWFERHIYPTDEGLAVYFRDITTPSWRRTPTW
jgi:PAS domain S-box-containing protein